MNLWTEDLIEESTQERIERESTHVPVNIGGSKYENIALPKY